MLLLLSTYSAIKADQISSMHSSGPQEGLKIQPYEGKGFDFVPVKIWGGVTPLPPVPTALLLSSGFVP